MWLDGIPQLKIASWEKACKTRVYYTEKGTTMYWYGTDTIFFFSQWDERPVSEITGSCASNSTLLGEIWYCKKKATCSSPQGYRLL